MNKSLAKNKLEILLSQNKSNLTKEQQRLLFLKKLNNNYPINLIICYEFKSSLDIEKLQLSISMVISNCKNFSRRFIEVAGHSISVESENRAVSIELLPKGTNVDDIFIDFSDRELKYEDGELIKFKIVQQNEKQFALIIIASKLVVDIESMHNIVIAISTHFVGFAQVENKTPKFLLNEISPINIEKLENITKDNELYWRQHLDQSVDTAIIEDYHRTEVKTHHQKSILEKVDENLLEAITRFANFNKVSVNCIFQSAFYTLVYRYTKQDDICIGVNYNFRGKIAENNLVGPFETVLPRRIIFNEDLTFLSLLEKIALLEMTVEQHGNLSFARIVEIIGVKRNLQKTPLFQTAYSYSDLSKPIYEGNGFSVACVPINIGTSEVDVQLNVIRGVNSCSIRIDYNADIYAKSLIENLSKHLQMILIGMLENPELSCKKVALVSHEEHKNLIELLKGPKIQRDSDLKLHDLFEMQAKLTPDNIAVISEFSLITYSELSRQSNKLANFLSEQRLVKDEIIAIVLDRSIETVIAIMAILKAGCAYMAIEADYPNERIEWMINDSGCDKIISQKIYRPKVQALKKKIYEIDKLDLEKYSDNAPEIKSDPNSLAYVIYTSGTTGKPKGTLLTHNGIVNNILWRQESWPLNPDDKILMNSSFSFDPSVWGVFWPLSAGASTLIISTRIKSDINQIIKLMISENITVIGTVPSFISMLMEHPGISRCKSLRLILSGGEVLSKELQNRIHTQSTATLVNIFGPTETTIDASYYVCSKSDNYRVAPIGKAATNLTIQVLDEYLKPVPQGVKGEIYVSGVGLARGYLNQQMLTQAKFINNPNSQDSNDRLYKTGDLGRINSNGYLEYVGRIDRQIKIRGHRVELAEIEEVLLQHPNIREAVILDAMNGDDCILNAYVCLFEGTRLKEETLRNYLAIKLPKYMLPNNYLITHSLPKNTNGKIDFRNLPIIHHENKHLDHQRNIASDPIENAVSNYFCDALANNQIDKRADFFELGGTSLMLTRLASNLYKHFDLDIPLYQFFKIPTIEAVTEIIKKIVQGKQIEIGVSSNLQQLETDSILDEDINPNSVLSSGDFSDPSAVLLTGATGYLGSFLLDELLKQTNANVYCLVRAKTVDEGLLRIKTAMQAYYIWNEEYHNRIKPIIGDLALPKLGISEILWDSLAKNIDIIYHNGAMVNFAYPYSALRDANVMGTKEILRLACKAKLKSVNYMSTIDVLLAAHCSRPFIEDDAPIKNLTDIPGGYTGTKWVAERLIYEANARGIPTTIYRPSLVMGHTETGATQFNDYLLVSFKGFIPMKIMPEYPRIFDVVPVDFVAKSLVYISRQKNIFGKFFHLFNQKPSALSNFLDWTRSFGYQFNVVPFNEAKNRALEVGPEHPLYPLIPLFRDANPIPQRSLDPNHIDEVNTELECKNTFNVLKGSQIESPILDENMVHLCMNYLVQAGFLPDPKVIT